LQEEWQTMKKLLYCAAFAGAVLLGGCATGDADQFYRAGASADCEVGTGGAGQPPCKTAYWSSRDGFLDPHEEKGEPRRD